MSAGRPSGALIDRKLREVSERLKHLRIERGLRLADLAAMTGFSEAHLYRVEEGERALSLSGLLRLADAHGVSASSLLQDSDPPARVSSHDGMAVWTGDEETGEGLMWAENSGRSRFDRDARLGDGADMHATTPEQHIGMALAGCFSMSLARQLAAAGLEPRRVETRAHVSLHVSGDGVAIGSIALETIVDAPEADAARIKDLAQHTRKTCVVARALAAVPVTLEVLQDDGAAASQS
jgi:OsmC subfamily peroxiredoxin